jgi:hypothetical protein
LRLVKACCLLVCLLLVACDSSLFPEYWLCNGLSTQVFTANDQAYGKKYGGQEKLLLELYKNTVTQYTSKAFTGVYYQCESKDSSIVFQNYACTQSSSDPARWSRTGSLDKRSGMLSIQESRVIQSGRIKGEGSFSCQYLGRHFSSEVFY